MMRNERQLMNSKSRLPTSNDDESSPVEAEATARTTNTDFTTMPTNKTQDNTMQMQQPNMVCQHHQRRASSTFISTRSQKSSQSFVFGFIFVTLTVFLLASPPNDRPQLAEGAKIKKAVKSIAKGLLWQQLTMRKNFLPLPVPIPVPIEINEQPIYLKGKPKYVNIYKKTKPTPQPVVKPTTVYHMPIYSPTYEYMSMDPMYSSSMVYNPYGASGASSYKSSVSTDGDGGTSSMASATNGVDYDDDTGSYYVRKSAARRRKLVPSDYALDMNLHRNDEYNRASNEQRENELADQHSSQQHSSESEHSIYKAGGEDEEQDIEAGQPNDDESYDHEDDMVSWLRNRHNPMRQRRMKRQVYYESGYDGNTNCEGFPLEINVRSRIKLDRIFPIHGKSQIKKCVKIKKTLLPPMHEDSY